MHVFFRYVDVHTCPFSPTHLLTGPISCKKLAPSPISTLTPPPPLLPLKLDKQPESFAPNTENLLVFFIFFEWSKTFKSVVDK